MSPKGLLKWLTAPAMLPVLVRLLLALAAAAAIDVEPLVALCAALPLEAGSVSRPSSW